MFVQVLFYFNVGVEEHCVLLDKRGWRWRSGDGGPNRRWNGDGPNRRFGRRNWLGRDADSRRARPLHRNHHLRRTGSRYDWNLLLGQCMIFLDKPIQYFQNRKISKYLILL